MDSRYKKNNSNRKVSLFAEAGILIDDNVYFFSSEYNLLYKIHIPDFSISIISHIPCEKIYATGWFRDVIFWKGKLIFVPSYAEKIWIYDLSSGKWDSISIDYPEIELKFGGALTYKDNMFLFGIYYPFILKVNLNNYSISYIEVESCIERKKEKEGLFFSNVVSVGHMAFCPVSVSNQVLQFDLRTSEYKWHYIGSKDNKYSGIDFEKGYFWISPGWKGKIVKWDGNLKWKEFEVPEEIVNHRYQFVGVICDDNKIIFLTQQDGRSFVIDNKIDGDIQNSLTQESKSYVHLKRYGNETIILMQINAYLEIKWEGKWLKNFCEVHYEEFKAYFEEIGLWSNIYAINKEIEETKIQEIKDYIDFIIREPIFIDKFSENNKGLKIWRSI